MFASDLHTMYMFAVNTKLFSAWLQENQEYDIAANMYIVWYTPDEDEVS